MSSVTYTFGWPPSELSPNARVHWRTLANAKADYKDACGWIIRGVDKCRSTPLAAWCPPMLLKPPVTAQVTFVCDARRRDPDNHMAMLKPLWDALVEMGVLEDDSKDVLTILAPKWERGSKKIIVELRGEK